MFTNVNRIELSLPYKEDGSLWPGRMLGKLQPKRRIDAVTVGFAIFVAGLRSGDPDAFLEAVEAAFGFRVRVATEELARWAEDTADAVEQAIGLSDFTTDNRGQLGFQTLVAAFIVVITGLAVVLVLDKFDASLGTPSNTDLSNSSTSLLSGFASMVDLIEPLLLIAIVVVLIALVRRVG